MTETLAGDWRTPAEIAEYRVTPDYGETFRFVERIALARPDLVRVEKFGTSGEGRELPVVIVSAHGAFSPEAARSAGDVVLLVQNCIHAGEPDGKDACLALLRDIAIHPRRTEVLPERVVLLIVPIYNVDGHERTSLYHRINQNGPEAPGWRANGANLNLNRDYMKAEAPETRAFLRLFQRWLPDFFVDNHVTDGTDFQYDVTFQLDATPDVFPATAEWVTSSVIPEVVRHINASGHLAFPSTIFLRDDLDPSQGLAFNENPPRFSTGQMILENRPGLLVEMHMLKPYRTRVGGNYELLRALLPLLGRDAGRLRALNRDADRAASRLGQSGGGASFPLVVAKTGETTTVAYRGREFERFRSEVSGREALRYGPGSWNVDLPFESAAKVEVALTAPAAYLIPPPWSRVIDVLAAHGVRMLRTATKWTGTAGRYRCAGMRWPGRPFEGRFPILRGGNVEREFGTFGTCTLVAEETTFPGGSTVVPLNQRSSKVAIHWLEPEAPDSALRWGFFDSIFEQKEGGEGYVLEALAAEELQRDPTLRGEFEGRLRTDPSFAASPSERLAFFYDRSPWGVAARVGVYPVVRLRSLEGLPLE